MATTTTKLGLRKPTGSDLVNVLIDIANSMDTLDNAVIGNPTATIGAGAQGADSTTVIIGSYDADYAWIQAGQPVRTSAHLMMQPKGANGHMILRDGTATNLFDLYPASALSNGSTCCVIAYKTTGGTLTSGPIKVGASGTGPGGSGQALYI